MSRDRLGEALRDLPRHRAEDGFTAKVLRRLDETTVHTGSRSVPRRLWLPAGAVAAAALSMLAALAWWSGRSEAPMSPPQAAPTVAEMEAQLQQLRREHAEIKRRLGALRELPVDLSAQREGPVLYLGGDDNLDLVLDLSRDDGHFREAGRGPGPGRVRPAKAGGPNSS